MGIWAEIKIALNSTIGTNKFKPLDILLQESYTAGMELVASDSLYKLLVAGTQEFIPGATNPKITVAKITLKTGGSLRIKWDNFRATTEKNGRGGYIYKNGSVIYTAQASSAGAYPGYVDIIYSAGDVIEVIAQHSETISGDTICAIQNMGIYGTLTNGRLAEVIL